MRAVLIGVLVIGLGAVFVDRSTRWMPLAAEAGPHVALARALAAGRVQLLGKEAAMAGIDQLVAADGRILSNRAPGFPTALVPLCWVDLRLSLLLAVAYGVTLLAVGWWLRCEGCGWPAVGVAILAVATSLFWHYVRPTALNNLHAHVLTGCLLVTGLALAWHGGDRAWWGGLALTYAGIAEYPYIVLAPLVLAWVWWRRGVWRTALVALPLAWAALYHTLAFGAPWRTFQQSGARAAWPAAESFAGTLAGPLIPGVRAMLLGGMDSWHNPVTGILTYAPALWLVPIGVVAYGGIVPRRAAMLTTLLLASLGLHACHVAFAAGVGQPRYLVPLLPLAAILIGHAVEAGRWPMAVVGGWLALQSPVGGLLVTHLFPWG